MTDADDVIMEMIILQIMSFCINPYSVGGFPVFYDPMLIPYPNITHGTRHGQEVGNIDRGYDDDDRG